VRLTSPFRRLSLLLPVALLALLAACAPVPEAIGPRTQSPALEPAAIRTGDGSRLPLRATLPAGKPRRILIAVHGMNDYGTFIREAADWFATQGIATYAYDQRGFGESPGRGLWFGGPVMTRDLAELTQALHLRHPDVPIHILGESMGGAVTLLAGLDEDLPGVEGLILSAPAVWGRASMGLMPRVSLWLTARLFPGLTLSGSGLRITPSDNIAMLRALGRDPLVIKGTRVATLHGLVGLMDDALARAGGGRLPTLILYGSRDEIIPPPPVCTILHQYRDRHEGRWQVALYDTGYHMLLRDLAARVVWQDIADWMEGRPLSSGRDVTATPGRWPGCRPESPA
jgi:alpha-beta hydrolase superfamily lysophospholipase